MSLSKLPSPLLAQIASFLELKNIKDLLLVNKRINCALKEYKFDKPKCFKLDIGHFEKQNSFIIHIYPKGWNLAKKGPVNEKKENWTLEDNDLADKMCAIVNKFISIEELYIRNIDISHEFVDLLSGTKQKLRELIVANGAFESIEVFEKCCARFDNVICNDAKLNLDEFATDEVFCAAVKLANICVIDKGLVLESIMGHTHQFYHEVSLTDRVLESLSSCVEVPAEKLRIPLWITSFTVEGVKQLLEKISSKEPTDFSCDLGVMKMDQMEAADELSHELDANPTFNGKVKDCFYYKSYKIRRFNGDKNKLVIKFIVMTAKFYDDDDTTDSSDDSGDLGESDAYSENEDESDEEAIDPDVIFHIK